MSIKIVSLVQGALHEPSAALSPPILGAEGITRSNTKIATLECGTAREYLTGKPQLLQLGDGTILQRACSAYVARPPFFALSRASRLQDASLARFAQIPFADLFSVSPRINSRNKLSKAPLGPKTTRIPHLQLEPTARGPSELESIRTLRLTKARKARHQKAIKAFNRAFPHSELTPIKELFSSQVKVKGRQRNVSEPSRPDPELFVARKRAPSPVTPSPKESAHEESSDDFEATDNPRNLPPGAFIATPKQLTAVAYSEFEPLSTLTSLSDLEREFPSIPKTHLNTETSSLTPRPTVIAPQAPNSIRDRQALISHVAGFRMPIRGTDGAPKYDGSTENLLAFIDDYEDLADQAGLGGADRIRGIIRYVPTSERELWSETPEAKGGDYAAFIKEVKRMYPGCEGDRRYAVADLQTIARNQASKSMYSVKELGDYQRAFLKVARALIDKDRIGKAERDRIFLEGFPSDIQAQTRTRLMIKFPDHHPQDPYPFNDVVAAAQFLLPGIGVAGTVPTSTPALSPGFSPSYAPSTTAQAPVQQQSTPNLVVKQEYVARRAGGYGPAGCIFCGGADHYMSRCREKEQYIAAGKCKVDTSTNKLVLPNGGWIPGRQSDGTLKERLDRHYTNQAANEALPEAVVEVEPSAFVHTIADSEPEMDEEDLDVLRATQALALATARCDQKKSEAKNKGKNIRFDGVELEGAPRARPGPLSKHASETTEIISPARGGAKPVKAKEVAPVASSSSSTLPDANTASPSAASSSNQYRFSFALEDKEADKRVIERLLDSNIAIPVRELLAVSPKVRKNFCDLTTTKRVAVGSVLVNKLIGQPSNDEWLCEYDEERLRSSDGKIVADHCASLQCVRATTVGGRILTCVLDQGAEVVVMPKVVWKSLGIGLRLDYRLNMESVNTSKDTTLGVVENVPLDFGGGPMYFQVQVTEYANFEILLGRPFFKLTACRTFDLPDGEQGHITHRPQYAQRTTHPYATMAQAMPALHQRDDMH
ncbi:hypothetical protein EDD22DRAFT_953827 [Suillus occidentalis]|nr:hypothetical protein EDD22DRAFT_953827 [Suillus occidentalis]